jgi:SAM-dependent methyltransferase
MFYDKIAQIYDNHDRDELSRASARVAKDELERRGIAAPDRVLDLACGTGLITQLMHEYGYSLTGVDVSEGMLSIAKERAVEGPQPQWELGDILEYQSPRPFAAVLCFGDVINHFIQPKALRQLIARAYSLLAPGGIFLADTNTLDTYRSKLWNEEESFTLDPDLDIEMRAWFEPGEHLAYLCTTATCKRAVVYDELLIERHYPEGDIQQWLEAHGFREVTCQVYNPMPDLDEIQIQKNLWIARKPD